LSSYLSTIATVADVDCAIDAATKSLAARSAAALSAVLVGNSTHHRHSNIQ